MIFLNRMTQMFAKAEGRGQYMCLKVKSDMRSRSITVLLIYPSLQMQVLFQVVATHSRHRLVALWPRSLIRSDVAV